MLKRISHRIVQKMNKVIPRTEEDCIKMEYMLEVILDQITILFVVFLLCSCMGYLRESLICFICIDIVISIVFANGWERGLAIGASLGTITILPIFNKESKLDLMNILREIKKIK